MVSSEVQRTLVKSPPELWAEISDAEALARHLNEFGEIRITRVQPEQKVEWEADEARGTVVIKPSGWGTKVKLTVTRELTFERREAEPTPNAESAPNAESTPDGEPTTDAEPAVEVEIDADEPVAGIESSMDEAQAVAEPAEAADADEPVAAEREREPRRGFFAKLFGRRRTASAQPLPAPEPPAMAEPELEPAPAAELLDEPADDAEAEVAPASGETPLAEPTQADDAGEQSDIAAELTAAEEIAAEQVTAVLTSVLDRLGAAHHRPFSRS